MVPQLSPGYFPVKMKWRGGAAYGKPALRSSIIVACSR